MKSRGQMERFHANESFESERLNQQLGSQRGSTQTSGNFSMADCKRTNSSRRPASVLRPVVIKKR